MNLTFADKTGLVMFSIGLAFFLFSLFAPFPPFGWSVTGWFALFSIPIMIASSFVWMILTAFEKLDLIIAQQNKVKN